MDSRQPGIRQRIMGLLTTRVHWTSVQNKRAIRVRDFSFPLQLAVGPGQAGGTHDNFFTSDILIITLLSNFLLQYVESKLGLGMATEQTERK